MIKYNFRDNYQGLNEWNYTRQKAVVQIQSSEDGILVKYYKISKNFINNNKIFYFPPITAASILLLINILSIVPSLNISRLESDHYEFEEKEAALTVSREKVVTNVSTLMKHSKIITDGADAFLFAYFLQLSVPENMQLTEYTVDNVGFKIIASAEDMDSINSLIQIMLKWPIVKPETLKVRRIITQQQSGQFSNSTINTPSILEITGKINIVDLSQKLEYYKKTYNYGFVKKIDNQIKLINLTKTNN